MLFPVAGPSWSESFVCEWWSGEFFSPWIFVQNFPEGELILGLGLRAGLGALHEFMM